jgi:DNA-directed RNA polymerase subunit H (RpoH/RPB5)
MHESTNSKLLEVKKRSIEMMSARGYDVSEDLPVLDYEPDELEDYFEYAKEAVDTNAIRSALMYDKGDSLLNLRSALSTLYESKERPDHYAMVFFVPIRRSKDNKSVSKQIIQIPIEVCLRYPWTKQTYCSDCSDKFDSIKQCSECPIQQFCEDTFDGYKCDECEDGNFCRKCKNKMRKFRNYLITYDRCENCTEEKYCDDCDKIREEAECKDCSSYKIRHGNKSKRLKPKDECNTCFDKLKCSDCTEDGLCDDCNKKYDPVGCENCPLKPFCEECMSSPKLAPCKNCPDSPKIIEQCVIISDVQLSSDAKQVATTPYPRVRATTGELLEVGCLTQVFMYQDFFFNPLKHNLGCRYQVLTTQQTIDYYKTDRNNVKEGNMHKLDMAGPICKYLGLYPGQMVRIERDSVVPGTIVETEIVNRIVNSIPIVKKNRRRGANKKGVIVASGAGVNEE